MTRSRSTNTSRPAAVVAGALGCLALAALAVLAGFYAVVTDAVRSSAERRFAATAGSTSVSRQVGPLAAATLVRIGAPSAQDD